MTIHPLCHLNGTGRDTLIAQREAAYSALTAAIRAFKAMAPNGRDYYVEPGLLEQALEQHDRRLRALTDLQDELEAELENLEA